MTKIKQVRKIKNRYERDNCKMTLRPVQVGASIGFVIPKRLMIIEYDNIYEIEIRRVRY